jgi:uncharacterized protein YjbI with pentapeptide repeats
MSARKSSLKPEAVLLSAAAFEARVKAHEAFVLSRPGGARGLMRYVVARGLRCDRRRLSDVDFTGADLTATTFVGADLSRASLYCANLTRCDLRAATLFRADLRGGTYAGANLAGANLDQADMRAAVLCMADDQLGLKWVGPTANANGASLNGVDLSESQSQAVDFTNCSMKGALLRNANLKNANFSNANLDGVDLQGAKLAGVIVKGAILTNIDTSLLARSGVSTAGCVLDPTAAAFARLGEIRRELEQSESWGKTNGRAGRPANLDGFDLRPANTLFPKQLLAGLSARGAMAVGVDFSDTQLQGAVFDDADLRGANFRGADLRGASFRRAKLNHAVFDKADLTALEVQGGQRRAARFDGAQLAGTGITYEPGKAAAAAAAPAPAPAPAANAWVI